MSFDTPGLLYFLFLIVPVFLALLFRRNRRRRGIEFLAAPFPSGERESKKREFALRVILSDVFFVLFLVFVIIGLSGPSWGTEVKTDTRKDLDLVLAFDLSRSMNARDCPPLGPNREDSSRLERARSIARELCFRLDNARFAAAAGKGRGVLMVPLTYDSEAIFGFFDSLDDSLLTGSGTNLESLIDAAAGAFTDSMNRRKGIVIFTDGEGHQGSWEKALDRARDADIAVSVAGLGSGEGARIPVEKTDAAPDGVLLDPGGVPVVSMLREEALKTALADIGGSYAAGSGDDAALLLADFYESLTAESRGGLRREPAARWHIFVIAGLVCLGLSRLPGFRRKLDGGPRVNGGGKGAGVLLSLVAPLVLLFSGCAPVQGKLLIMEGNFRNSRQQYNEAVSSYLKARDFPDVLAYAEYGLGLSYSALEEHDAALEKYAEAEKTLGNAAEHEELRYRLIFNKGIIQFEKGEFEEAARSFRKALEINGSRLDAKRNLELSLLSLANENRREASASASQSSGEEADAGSRSQALFDYIRQREQDQWRNEWTGETPSVWPDY